MTAKGPLHALSHEHVLQRVRRGHCVPPTADEISNQSKGDGFSKGIAIIQTLCFVVQCMARHVKRFPVTSLEIMTLAYAVMTVAMYAARWSKPLNVSCAVHVPDEESKPSEAREYKSNSERILVYAIDRQDTYVDLCKHIRLEVPTFWAGRPTETEFWLADIIAFFLAMVFGEVHCFAWYSEFQSHIEQQLWRSSAIAIIAVPATLAALFLMADVKVFDKFVIGGLYMLIFIIYIGARFILITLSFMSLNGLPAGAYRTVKWTTLIPHI